MQAAVHASALGVFKYCVQTSKWSNGPLAGRRSVELKEIVFCMDSERWRDEFALELSKLVLRYNADKRKRVGE